MDGRQKHCTNLGICPCFRFPVPYLMSGIFEGGFSGWKDSFMHDTHVHEDDYLSLYRGKNTKEP